MSIKGKGKLAPTQRGPSRPSPPTPLSWPDFARTLLRIYQGDFARITYEGTYRMTYLFCLCGQGRKLYDGVGKLVEDQLIEDARLLEGSFPTAAVIPKTVSGGSWPEPSGLEGGEKDGGELRGGRDEDEQFLREVKALRDRHTVGMRNLADVLIYLDKNWALEHDKPRVVDVFTSSFVDLILRSTSPSIADHIFSCLVRLVQIDREGGEVDRELLKSVLDVLMLPTDVKDRGGRSVFQSDVEQGLLAWSEACYERKTERLRESLTAVEYDAEVARLAEDERSRTADYLPTQTTLTLEQVVLRAGKSTTSLS